MKTLIRLTETLFRILFWAAVVTACCALFSCRTVQYVPVENTHTSETEKHNVERDSIHVHDSVYIYLQGDTVYEERWKTIYKEVFRTDTFFITKTDSINHIVEVEKKLTKWQQTKMDVGAGVMYAVPILVAVGLFILYRKLKK
jgi:hypothetical protein